MRLLFIGLAICLGFASHAATLAEKLAAAKFTHHAKAPGYSEGPTWINGEVVFCSDGLRRVDKNGRVTLWLDIGAAGTVLRADGHLLIADNKHKALLSLAPDGTLSVLAEKFDGQPLNSLNDLTVDARGNIYWTDPSGSSLAKPVGNIFRLRPDGTVSKVGTGFAFPNGLDVDPAGKHLYLIESQSKKILRFALPADDQPLGAPELFFDLGGSGGDGCAFDAEGNLWVADFHRPETKRGRITVLSPAAKVLGQVDVPAQVVSNIAFGGANHDEIFCTTGTPDGVFHAKVGVKGFAGHPGAAMKPLRTIALQPHEGARRPNLIFIMADDLGYTDVACFGSKYYETPNLDRLAAQGMKLLSHHHCQNCTPTRAALMSGQYGARTGVYTVGGIDRFDWSKRPLRPVDNVTDLPLDRDIIAKQLKAAGYATGMFGKWHIGERGEYHPGKRGFDEAIVSAGLHFDFATNPKTDYPKGQYLADFLTDKAVDFITRHKDKPFFLYLPHFGVHSPHQAKPDLIAKFKTKPGVGGHNSPIYAAMIASVDESVGRVMKTLDDLKLADNTVMIFTSDNGGVGGYSGPLGLLREPGKEGQGKKAKGADADGGGITDNAPLRSGKGSLYEGGTREPFIVRWPSVTRPGSVCDVPTIHVDIFPTLLEVAAAPKPRQVLDGESLVKLFRDPSAKLQRDAIYQHFPGYLGSGPGLWRTTPVSLIQMGDWKLMEYLEDGKLELYNLRSDIGETKNLAKEMPDKAKELHARLVAWRAEVQAPTPMKNISAGGKTEGKSGTGKKKAAAKKASL